MITSWRISNFKSIREPVELPLAPLTVFSGPNSSGKSTFIQSILMAAQSLGSSAWEEPLVLNGRFIRLGRLEDVLHRGSEQDEIEIGFDLETDSENQLSAHAVIRRTPTPGNASWLQARVMNCWVESRNPKGSTGKRVELRRERIGPTGQEVQQATSAVQEYIRKGLFNYQIIDPAPTELSTNQFIEQPLCASVSNFMPGRALARVRTEVRKTVEQIDRLTAALRTSVRDRGAPRPDIDWDEEVSEELVRALFGQIRQRLPRRDRDRYHKVVYELSEWRGRFTIGTYRDFVRRAGLTDGQIKDLSRRLKGVSLVIQEHLAANTRLLDETSLEVKEFPVKYNRLIDDVRRVLGASVHYLGPLRDDPRVIYATPPLPNRRDVGLKGEYTAAMLDIFGEDPPIQYPVPTGDFKGKYTRREGSLADAVQMWLHRMDLGDTIATSENAKVGYRLTVQPTGLQEPLDLTSIGVGVSQILPILVMGLLTRQGSVLVFEQPEVHLHPKVQSILGDFFLGIAQCGKQCIVETHSEYLIKRLQRRVAESRGSEILNDLRIYFAERQNSVSHFRAVEPNEYGAILDWPKGFFDEAEVESSAIVDAAMKKRRQSQREADLTGDK